MPAKRWEHGAIVALAPGEGGADRHLRPLTPGSTCALPDHKIKNDALETSPYNAPLPEYTVFVQGPTHPLITV